MQADYVLAIGVAYLLHDWNIVIDEAPPSIKHEIFVTGGDLNRDFGCQMPMKRKEITVLDEDGQAATYFKGAICHFAHNALNTGFFTTAIRRCYIDKYPWMLGCFASICKARRGPRFRSPRKQLLLHLCEATNTAYRPIKFFAS